MHIVINRHPWGTMLLPHHLICGTECCTDSSLSDHSSEQILKLGIAFKTWGLHTPIWVSLCPQQKLLPALFCVVLSREGQSIQQNPGGLQSSTLHQRQLFHLDPRILVTLLAFIYFGVE